MPSYVPQEEGPSPKWQWLRRVQAAPGHTASSVTREGVLGAVMLYPWHVGLAPPKFHPSSVGGYQLEKRVAQINGGQEVHQWPQVVLIMLL